MNAKAMTLLVSSALALAGCASSGRERPPLPRWSFASTMIFPPDRSLTRPEDGVLLADGRLIVADQVHGLRLVRADGSSRPFGRFAEAGYVHDPPAVEGAPNGVSLAPSGRHVIIADVCGGGIYRVDVATEATERVYQHRYGVNTAVADQRGGIWFTQSARNTSDEGQAGLFRTVDVPAPEGALLYLPPPTPGVERAAVVVADGFEFANGIVLDEPAGLLYMAETMGSRVWRFRLDDAPGRVRGQTVALEIGHPDNLERDGHGRIWIARPLQCAIDVFDPATGGVDTVFRIATPQGEQLMESIDDRLRDGDRWLDLMVPTLWEPGPGLMTGIILPPDDRGAVYVTNLGDALIRLDR